MDFRSVLKTASERQPSTSQNGSNFYKTKFDPPKKESKSRTLSANIQKFLAKKEEEDRQKTLEMRRKRDELIAMRDTKTTNKIKKMLKVIKSANKSVLEDAVDNVNTAVTMDGPDQPDEDDYGYVSQEATALYSKLMEKYKHIPEEEKFAPRKKPVNSDLSGTKDRVRAAIMRQQEEELLPHKRKRRTHGDSYEEEEIDDKPVEKYEEKPKPKRPSQPPPMDFNQLLKIAEKKQFEPIMVETKKPEVDREPERLMTKKQKREYEEQKAYQEARLRRERERAMSSTGSKNEIPSKSDDKRREVSKPQSSQSTFRVPKLSDKNNSASTVNNNKMNNSSVKPDKKEIKPTTERNGMNKSSKDIQQKPRSSPNASSHSKPLNVSNDKIGKLVNSNRNSSSVSSQNGSNRNGLSPSFSSKPISGQNKMQMAGSKLNNRNLPSSPSVSSNKVNKLQNENQKNIKSLTEQHNYKLSNATKDRVKLSGSTSNLDNRIGNMHNGIQKSAKPNTERISNEIKVDINKANRPLTNSEKLRMIEKKKLMDKAQSLNKNIKNQNDVKTRSFPPPDVRQSRPFPPPDVRGVKQFPPPDMMKKKLKQPVKRNRIDDDDSEYDSSMEDFIDDGPEDGNDVSKYIKEIFGYDKSRYRDVDDNDAAMESNYSQVMKEEYISKKIGILEDLEDMKKEAEEKKRKAMKRRRID